MLTAVRGRPDLIARMTTVRPGDRHPPGTQPLLSNRVKPRGQGFAVSTHTLKPRLTNPPPPTSVGPMNINTINTLIARAVYEAALEEAKKDKAAYADLLKVAPNYPLYDLPATYSEAYQHWENVVIPKAVRAVVINAVKPAPAKAKDNSTKPPKAKEPSVPAKKVKKEAV